MRKTMRPKAAVQSIGYDEVVVTVPAREVEIVGNQLRLKNGAVSMDPIAASLVEHYAAPTIPNIYEEIRAVYALPDESGKYTLQPILSWRMIPGKPLEPITPVSCYNRMGGVGPWPAVLVDVKQSVVFEEEGVSTLAEWEARTGLQPLSS